MVQLQFTLKVDDSSLKQYSKLIAARLQKGQKRWLDNNLRFLAAKAKLYAAFDTGRLRKGIFITKRINSKTAKGGKINWRELDSGRGQSFERSRWGSFIRWLHNSPEAHRYAWKKGQGMPSFMTFTINKHRREVIKNAELMIQQTIRGK